MALDSPRWTFCLHRRLRRGFIGFGMVLQPIVNLFRLLSVVLLFHKGIQIVPKPSLGHLALKTLKTRSIRNTRKFESK